MRRRFALLFVSAMPLALAGLAASCGARTGLPLPVEVDATAPDRLEIDTFVPPDVLEEDAPEDVPPDMVVPDVVVNQCPDAAATLIYVVTVQNQLWSFDPSTLFFTTVGTLNCPAAASASPFSMAVNRHGIAYIVYDDGELFRVSTASAACAPTAYKPQPMGSLFNTFGMGFVADLVLPPDGGTDAGTDAGLDGAVESGTEAGEAGIGEVVDRLFVAGAGQSTTMMATPSQLGTISTTTYALSAIGAFHPQSIFGVELTGTGDGRLFAYYDNGASIDAQNGIAQIDPLTAAIVQSWPVDVPNGQDWAFAFYGGVFYIFTSPASGTPSQVHRFDPSDSSLTLVTTAPEGVTVDGAGVSTCAPTN